MICAPLAPSEPTAISRAESAFGTGVAPSGDRLLSTAKSSQGMIIRSGKMQYQSARCPAVRAAGAVCEPSRMAGPSRFGRTSWVMAFLRRSGAVLQ